MLNRGQLMPRRLLILQRALEALYRAELTLKKCHSDSLANRDHPPAKFVDKPRRSRWQLHRVNPISFPASKRPRPFTVNWHHKHHKGARQDWSFRGPRGPANRNGSGVN
jgi:hypothetical protein